VTQEQGEEPQVGDEERLVWSDAARNEVIAAFMSGLSDLSIWDFTPLYEDRIFHYTSHDGLLSIVKNRSLRATRITHLNDASELLTGQAVMREVLKDFQDLVSVDAKRLLDYLDERIAQAEIYVACCSKAARDLTQLDRYGEVSIALDPNDSLTCWDDENTMTRSIIESSMEKGWREVLYDADEQRTWAEYLFGMMLGVAKQEYFFEEGYFARDGLDLLLYWYGTFLAMCKNQHYEKEEEVRYVVHINSPSAIEHRASPVFGITPFVTLRHYSQQYSRDLGRAYGRKDAGQPYKMPEIPRLKIEKVTIGSAPYKETAIQGVKSLFRTEGYPETPVEVVMEEYRKVR